MGKKLLIFIIILVGFALAGIIYVQVSYMKNAYNQNETLFDYKVNNALQSVVQNLDQLATVQKIHVGLTKSKSKHKVHDVKEINDEYDFNFDSVFRITIDDSLIQKFGYAPKRYKPDMPVYPYRGTQNFQKFSIPFNWSKKDTNFTFNQQQIIVNKNKHNKIKNKTTLSSNTFVHGPGQKVFVYKMDTVFEHPDKFFQTNLKFNSDSDFHFSINNEVVERKAKDIKKVMKKMVAETDTKIIHEIKKMNYLLIDSLLKSSLENRDINLAYEYKVIADTGKNEKIPSTKGFKINNNYRKYEALLFPNDIVPKTDKIIVYFPDRQNHLVKSLSILLPSSLLFSLIIIIAFTISIMMVLKQKKISDIKTDFINNMTHEFKTPIATISLAADTIINPKVIGDLDKINQFIGIIKDENKRMNLQVERILQMAQLERKDLDLNLEQIDIHQLIRKVVENIDVQIKQLNGKLTTVFEAVNTFVLIDEVHFTNVINNLLDNALKYTVNQPEIMIRTAQADNGVLLSFEDNGIGMSKEAQSKIFEKFYRVSKGNIHNVKGFGLGLSYVKAIVDAHGGRINVKSELNKGSRFDIYIPFKKKENGKSV